MRSILGWVRVDGRGEMDQGVKTRYKQMLKVSCRKGKQTGVGQRWQNLHEGCWDLRVSKVQVLVNKVMRRLPLMAILIRLRMIPKVVPTVGAQ